MYHGIFSISEKNIEFNFWYNNIKISEYLYFIHEENIIEYESYLSGLNRKCGEGVLHLKSRNNVI